MTNDKQKLPDEKSCGVILFRETGKGRQYLLLHYPGGHFDFPKGHVEAGEEKDEYSTAARELEEETGISNIEFVPEFRHEIFYTYNKKGKLSFKQVIFFVAKTETENVKISFEHKDFFWLPYNEALEKLTFDNAKNLLKKAEALLGRK